MVHEEMYVKYIIYLHLCGFFVRRGSTICAILVEGIIGNIPVKLF